MSWSGAPLTLTEPIETMPDFGRSFKRLMVFCVDMTCLYVYVDRFVNSKKLTKSTCQEPKRALTALFRHTPI